MKTEETSDMNVVITADISSDNAREELKDTRANRLLQAQEAKRLRIEKRENQRKSIQICMAKRRELKEQEIKMENEEMSEESGDDMPMSRQYATRKVEQKEKQDEMVENNQKAVEEKAKRSNNAASARAKKRARKEEMLNRFRLAREKRAQELEHLKKTDIFAWLRLKPKSKKKPKPESSDEEWSLETERRSKKVKKAKKSSEDVKQLVSSKVVETPSSFEDESIKLEELDDSYEDVAGTLSALSEIMPDDIKLEAIEDSIIPKNESE